jgi:uncharacterized protein (TIGR02147 family)
MKIISKINSEFDRRKAINPRYSLRAYAKSLNLDVSVLSRILANKSPISPKILTKIAVPLAITPEEFRKIEDEILQSKKSRRAAPHAETSAIQQLQVEEFKIIQDWYNYVILELTNIKDFEPSAEWISKKLSISEAEAQLALERLVKLNLLVQTDDGQFTASGSFTSGIQENFTTVAMRMRQKQVLQRASDAIDLIEFSERDQSAVTIAMDTALIPEVKDKIKKFRRSLANYIFKKSKNKNRVYEISISLFPWDNEEL